MALIYKKGRDIALPSVELLRYITLQVTAVIAMW
jgi:hypothetical protein